MGFKSAKCSRAKSILYLSYESTPLLLGLETELQGPKVGVPTKADSQPAGALSSDVSCRAKNPASMQVLEFSECDRKKTAGFGCSGIGMEGQHWLS